MPNKGTPGWHPSPTNPSEERYWDGLAWTGETRTRGAEPPTTATGNRTNDLVATVFGFAVIVGIVAVIIWVIMVVARGGADDDEAAAALNAHINGMGQDFASYSNYRGTQPDGGTGAVAIRTSLFDKPENEQYAQYMCSSLAFTRSSIPTIKHVRVLSSSDTTLAHCF